MSVEPIDYLDLTRKALRGVMSDALSHAAENGLVGEQHFYITFRANLRGVVNLPDVSFGASGGEARRRRRAR